MNAFLKSVAEYLYQTHKSNIQDVCMIFPNRRAGVFFSRYLSQLIDQPIWMPHIQTIADLMKDLCGYQLADPLTLTFDLYQVYKKEKKTEESFEEFYYWGEMLLNDFDDIDKYLVDTKQLFQNLSDIKEIDKHFTLPEEQIKIIKEFWTNVKLNESSHLKEDFISIWTVLHKIYTNYRERLRSKGIAYEGMLYRDVYEKIKNNGNIETTYKRFAIVGFNALSTSEKEFFKYLKKNNLADFFWDYDDYYVDNVWHEAGYFIRDNLKIFPQPSVFASHDTLTSPKNIEVIAVPSDIGQAKLISNILTRWNCTEGEMTETAVVLADEQLLIPVLTSLPEMVHDVNVTLGYPLRLTPVYSFFETLTAMHRNCKQNKEGQLRFYHRDVTALLNHPYLKIICGAETNELLNYIIQYNRVFVTTEELSKHEYLSQLFKVNKTANEFIHYLTDIGSRTARLLIEKQDNNRSNDFHREYWLSFITALNRLHDILTKENIVLEIPTLMRVLRKIIRSLSIPFKGEPLAGLQVMGMLETRTLDFANVILLSTNEGVLPRSEASTSFIPYNLRKGFGLPTIEHQDAVYAYYFYRLLQRAENVALLYNSQGGMKSGEMSRFLFQLSYEPAFQVSKHNMNFRIHLSDEKDIFIPKTEEILKSLGRFTAQNSESRYLTPTALNAYLECTLRFYFRYIAQIQVKEEVSEDIEGSMFGKLLHSAMVQLYAGFLKKNMSASDFDDLLKDKDLIEACILKAFAIEFFKKEGETPQLHGKSLVVKEVLRKYVLQILEVDKRLAPLTMLEFEKTFQTNISVDVAGKSIPVKIGGKIDRIDKNGNIIRVIDYKSGKVSYKFESIDQLFEVSGKKQNKEALQILLYGYILGEDKDYKHLSVLSGLYGMRDIFKRDFDYRLYQGKNELVEHFGLVREPYLSGLKNLIAEIFNPAVSFTKATDKKVCEFCDYKSICHR